MTGKVLVSRNALSYQELLDENNKMCDDLADIIENNKET